LAYTFPPTYKSPPIPAPPITCNAPDTVEVAVVESTNRILPVLNTPYVPPVTLFVPVAHAEYHYNALVSSANTNAAFVSVPLV
jgi:hypothetical protein